LLQRDRNDQNWPNATVAINYGDDSISEFSPERYSRFLDFKNGKTEDNYLGRNIIKTPYGGVDMFLFRIVYYMEGAVKSDGSLITGPGYKTAMQWTQTSEPFDNSSHGVSAVGFANLARSGIARADGQNNGQNTFDGLFNPGTHLLSTSDHHPGWGAVQPSNAGYLRIPYYNSGYAHIYPQIQEIYVWSGPKKSDAFPQGYTSVNGLPEYLVS
jgi:hypothetical protein